MYQAKDLFVIQTELIDMKVDMAINQAIDRVIQRIATLQSEMQREMHDLKSDVHNQVHELSNEMGKRFSSLEHRIIAVETRLGIVHGAKQDIYSRIKDHAFKAGWLILAAVVSYVWLHTHISIS